MDFLKNNIGTITVVLILAAIVSIIVIHMVKVKRSGRSPVCGCDCKDGCAGCHASGGCHKI